MTGIKKKKWLIKRKPENNELIVDLAESVGVSEALSTLLVNRGFTDEESAVSFIKKSQEKLHDPFLLNDMDKAVSRILLAIENKEKITIYGDYDVDGVTSVCNLFLYLKGLGAVVDYYIPCRKGEGYGVSSVAIDKICSNGTKLIITVDRKADHRQNVVAGNNERRKQSGHRHAGLPKQRRGQWNAHQREIGAKGGLQQHTALIALTGDQSRQGNGERGPCQCKQQRVPNKGQVHRCKAFDAVNVHKQHNGQKQAKDQSIHALGKIG